LDDYACTKCYKRASDGVVLHVHHKRYLAGRKPWEYPHHLCATMCSGCHAVEHGIIPPKFGWELVGYDDHGDLIGECDYCNTAIRYSFMVTHPKWRTLEVGEQCCDNLTCTLAASDHMESLRRHLDRRKRFVSSPRWQKDYSGALGIKQQGIFLELVAHAGAYRLRVHGRLGKKEFPTVLEAKAGAFDLIESGVIETWLEKHGARRRKR
jgi:hypothetical protein